MPQPNPFNSYQVAEKTYSFYTEATFAGNNWSGNVGVRVVRTTTLAATAESVPTDIWTLNSNNSVQSFNVDYSTASQFLQQATYTEALPSANLSYWVVPEQLQFRAAAGETISRPNLNQLAPNSTNQAINGTPELDYTGTAGLKPIKAWSVDLSLEWYYQPHAALNAALFGKKVTNDIYTATQTSVNLGTLEYDNGPPGSANNPSKPFLWTITAPANGAKSTYTGIELSWQHFLENGLGTHMQYTHTWSKGYDQFGNPTGAVNAAPPTTFSISLIYDKGPVQRGCELGLHLELHHLLLGVHRSAGVAGHRRFLLVGHGERSLPDLQGLRGVRRRQEPHQCHRAHLSQRQSFVAVGTGPARRRERQRHGSGLQRVRPQLRGRRLVPLLT